MAEMGTEIKNLKNLLKPELEKYSETFEKIMASNVRLVDQVAKYIVKHKGKGLRPLLVLLSGLIVGKPNQNTYIVASVIELLHTATLVHDDVVDDANVRRGFPSINAVWKNKIAVLMGDYLLSKSLIAATETGSLEIMNILSDTSKRMSKGELLQIEKSRKLDITEEEYFQIISDKTAALISGSCQLGAITVSDQEEDRQNLRNYGENLGIAFQIKDDLLDYESEQRIIGKPVGADLKEKKITLPLILSFQKASKKEKKDIIKLLKKGATTKDVRHIIDFCRDFDGLQLARNRAEVYGQRALESISGYPENDYTKSARKFVDYVLNRKK